MIRVSVRQPCSIRATPNGGLLPVVDAAIWRQSAERLQIHDWVRYGRAPSGTNLIGGGPVAFAILFQPLLAGQHRRKPLGSVRNGRPGINDLPHWGSAAGHREKAMEMQRLLFQVGLVCLLATPTPAGFSAHAQDYPAGPMKFITQLAAGGGTDPAMRIVIDHLGRMWGQQTTLINQPGAGGAIAARAASAATPDGYTLYMAIASTFISLPEIQPNLPFNVNDFVPIGFVGEVPMAIAVSPTLPVNSLPELIAYSRTQPGGLSVAIPNRGGIPHLATELFRERSGAELTYVFYPGSAQAMSDVISGRVQMIIEGLAGPLAGGQVKLLAVASPTRLASRPDLATVSETVPGFAASGWFVLVAPSGTPSSIVQKVSVDLREVLARPDVKQKFDELSLSTRPMSSQELGDFIRSERQLWKPVIKQIGLAMQ
jgi:tripartite-type tricarboxylate transporter receptor subunit TctC